MGTPHATGHTIVLCDLTNPTYLGNQEELVAALQAQGIQPINVLQNTTPGPGAGPSAAELTANITKSLLRCRADFPKQAQGEDFEVYLCRLEIAFSHDGTSNNTKIDCLIGHTTPTVAAAAQRLYNKGYHTYDNIADWLKTQFGLSPFKHFTRFLALWHLEDESWAQFGNWLQCEYIRYLPLSANDLPGQEKSITAALIGQLLAITTGGLHTHLYSKATADQTLTWVTCLAYADKYCRMHPNTPRASPALQNTQPGNRQPKTTASGVQKHYCDHHQQYILHTTAKCSLGQNPRPNTAMGNESPRNLQLCTYHPGGLVAHSKADCRNNPANQVTRQPTARTRETPRLDSDGCPLLNPPRYRRQTHHHHWHHGQTRHSTDQHWSHQVIHGDRRCSRSRAHTPSDKGKDLRSPLTHLRQHQPLIAIDYYSQRVVTTPIKRATANALCSFLADVFAQLGTFKIIHSDGAAVFNSAPYKRFITANQIASHIAQPYHPKGNGTCEQAIKSLSAIIAKTAPTPTMWDDVLLDAAIAYNQTPHTATGLPPFKLWHKEPILTPADIKFELPPRDITPELQQVKVTNQRYRKLYIQQANKHRKPEFKLGQMVTLRPQLKTTEKHATNWRFLPKRFGPFRITAVLRKAKYSDTEETDWPRLHLDPGTLNATDGSDDKAHPLTSSPEVHQACSKMPYQAQATPDRSLPRTPTATSPVSSVDIPSFDSPPQEPTPLPQPDIKTTANATDSPAPAAPNCQWRKRQRTSSPVFGHWRNCSTALDPSPTMNTNHNNLISTGSQDAQGSRPKRRRRRPSQYHQPWPPPPLFFCRRRHLSFLGGRVRPLHGSIGAAMMACAKGLNTSLTVSFYFVTPHQSKLADTIQHARACVNQLAPISLRPKRASLCL
ncbi:unnamed protein product [Notodromas monacha]|uniref:Integrase catalytic domain-containing protein n=1 Tax=Notodromas monacha TaxID=399045 RepID=A0A7R9BZL0_9CRUS|nr:unnamed protein product [Notodromas monacha]CAG0924590.1 unnamed protein product [Notodromas monacha]